MRGIVSLSVLRIGIFFLLALMGCGTAHVKVYKNPNGGSLPYAAAIQPLAYKVAVLPFTIEEEDLPAPSPNTILREVFYNYFSYLGYSDMPLEEIDKRLKDAGYQDSASLAALDPEEFKNLLDVEAVIKGHILNANNFTGGFYAETRIHAKLQMIELRSGRTLWETEHQEVDSSSLATFTLVNIIQQQRENVKTPKAYYKVAEEFSIKVLQHVPDPADVWEGEVPFPEINRIEADLEPNRKLTSGDTIQVSLLGKSGLTASYDIGSWKTSLPLVETRPGFYTGTYNVSRNDQITDALIIGRLVDKRGLTSKKSYKGATVTIKNQENITAHKK